ncbi:MAG: DUF4261 domain-containing protein [Candidatus Sericytochromatia bacterium]|uniref:DUF4261 domain-containing protein n=1 Tax=Candidatus Tanganyikabacteria bacterium TaxID=2961651 RepID=A0A938BP24_9BACT|nr:DUF4261 domain-containing protein [Candidatus Tanganyikabacteria bacterium]
MLGIQNDDQTVGVYTTGLEAFGHREIEIPRSEMDLGDLREWLHGIILYVLENGPILRDGETIGMTPTHKVRISHCPSKLDRPGTVVCLGEPLQ